MGRRKIAIEPITDERNRTVTFVKRKAGLFKKAYELAILCQVDVALVIVNNNNRVYEFCSADALKIFDIYKSHPKHYETKTPKDYGNHVKKSRIKIDGKTSIEEEPDAQEDGSGSESEERSESEADSGSGSDFGEDAHPSKKAKLSNKVRTRAAKRTVTSKSKTRGAKKTKKSVSSSSSRLNPEEIAAIPTFNHSSQPYGFPGNTQPMTSLHPEQLFSNQKTMQYNAYGPAIAQFQPSQYGYRPMLPQQPLISTRSSVVPKTQVDDRFRAPSRPTSLPPISSTAAHAAKKSPFNKTGSGNTKRPILKVKIPMTDGLVSGSSQKGTRSTEPSIGALIGNKGSLEENRNAMPSSGISDATISARTSHNSSNDSKGHGLSALSQYQTGNPKPSFNPSLANSNDTSPKSTPISAGSHLYNLPLPSPSQLTASSNALASLGNSTNGLNTPVDNTKSGSGGSSDQGSGDRERRSSRSAYNTTPTGTSATQTSTFLTSGAQSGGASGVQPITPGFRPPLGSLNTTSMYNPTLQQQQHFMQQNHMGDNTPTSGLPSRYVNDLFPSPSNFYSSEWNIPLGTGSTPYPMSAINNKQLPFLQPQSSNNQGNQSTGPMPFPTEGRGARYGANLGTVTPRAENVNDMLPSPLQLFNKEFNRKN